ncbi:hypothetical protein LJ655_25170 [Paraburkholderia sp. MMS20-SJTN17]|uniref:Uncharacterized protein n=1 Tax=Paraburkholderia translucens TaxID=2886945 RepID=A0ABS8KKA6_9BURK|nr:hypothetical protein [Paraburkholderia sp. MMS20-SJTN17]MCC8405130.1 hypothetical protein [Paraburkholderia sp. MMS20-SJTN17]
MPSYRPVVGRLLTDASPHSADNILGWPGRMAQCCSDNLARWNSDRHLLSVLALVVDG